MKAILLLPGQAKSSQYCMRVTCSIFTILSLSFLYRMQYKLKESFIKMQQTRLQTECNSKPKLRTFVKFKDFNTLPPHLYKSLSFIGRKMISKTRLGVLPLCIETARYLRPALPEAQRLCYCNNNEVESEQHVLYS